MTIWKTKWGWRAEFILQGQRVMAKGTFRFKDEARQWVKDEKERIKQSPPQSSSSGEEPETSFWVLAQKYLRHSQVDHSSKTFMEKKFCLATFYKFVGDVNVIDISPAMVLEFLNQRAKGMSNNAANKDRKNLKAFFRWVQEIYGIMHDPTGPVRMKPHSKKARRLIPPGDIIKVIMVATSGAERALLGSYWHTGARRGEVLRWTWDEDINLEERWVRLGTHKTGDGSASYSKLAMNDDLHGLLLGLWRTRDAASPYVFPSYYQPNDQGLNLNGEQRAHRLLYRLCTQAGVEPFGFHDIRHTVAKYLNDIQKVGIKKVQQVLRHRRQTTTEIYLDGNYTDTRAAMGLLEVENLKTLLETTGRTESQGRFQAIS
jgi:integrase